LTGRPAVLFPGQGAQQVGMLDCWWTHATARAVIEEAIGVTGLDLVSLTNDPEAMKRTAIVQPALLAVELAGWATVAGGVQPAAVAGHSLGEYAALVAAGVITAAAAFQIAAVRGRAMEMAAAATDGAMLAVMGLPRSAVEALASEARMGDVLVVANDNAPTQHVLAGATGAIERAEKLVGAAAGRSTRLAVAGAFHSPLMAVAQPQLAAAIQDTSFEEPRCAVIPNVTGRATTDAGELRALLVRHVTDPVLWDATMGELARLRVDHVLEIGPGRVLTGLAKRALPAVPRANLASPEAASEAFPQGS
jgi:[acyl-carrier-protein] S-malonyltransferase